MVRVLFLFLTRFHVSVARSNGNQQGAKIFPPKINACVPCVRVLCKTRSFIRSFSRLSWDASYLRRGVKGCSKIRRVLAKSRLYETCRLYRKFASYLVLCKTRLIFPRINGPIIMRGRCVSGHAVRESFWDRLPAVRVGYVTECIDREGLERRRTGTRLATWHMLMIVLNRAIYTRKNKTRLK